jgi:D-alanine-D-alanine ligase
VSLASAAAVFAHLDRRRYEPVPIKIEKDGRWALADRPPSMMSAGEVIEQLRLEAARPVREGREVHLVAHPGEETILSIDRTARPKDVDLPSAIVTGLALDAIFPMLHGPYGEDGTIQGLLELANVPYVGSGVLGSALGMDKAVMKVLFAARGLPVCPYRVVMRHEWERQADRIAIELERALKFPMFIKPANLGSSVGISKAKNQQGLRDAVALAAGFDRKIVVEAAVTPARELECGVLGNDRRASSTTTKRNTSTRSPRPSSRRSCQRSWPRSCASCRSKRSRRSTPPAWRASTSSSAAENNRCTSTK